MLLLLKLTGKAKLHYKMYQFLKLLKLKIFQMTKYYCFGNYTKDYPLYFMMTMQENISMLLRILRLKIMIKMM